MLQNQLAAENPGLPIQIVGLNEIGHESANDLMTSGRDLPWLQDVDLNNNNVSDVWYDQWDIVYRDVVIVDSDGVWRGAYNLTINDLGNAANFELLKSTVVQVAEDNPIWQNDSNPMDVNNDSVISPVGDVLTCINELNNHQFSDSLGRLPIPAATTSPPYLDVNGDYLISPVGDVLALINHLNNTPSGEGEVSVDAGAVSVDTAFLSESAPGIALSNSVLTMPELWTSNQIPPAESSVGTSREVIDLVLDTLGDAGDANRDDALMADLANDMAEIWSRNG